MSCTYTYLDAKITFLSQYHIGAGYGQGRLIDSLLRVDNDGIPVIPGTTVSGNVAQGLYDLLRFEHCSQQRALLCDFQTSPGPKSLPCSLIKPPEQRCLLCYFFGSKADAGIIQWVDFTCETDSPLLKAVLSSGVSSERERFQYIKPYVSHKLNMRTKTVMERHFLTRQEGSALLEFSGRLFFTEPVPEDTALFLAAALKNTKAIGNRKTRGKGCCNISGLFDGTTDIDQLIKLL